MIAYLLIVTSHNISSENALSIKAVKNYIQKISLDSLEKKFFISKFENCGKPKVSNIFGMEV